MVAMVKIQRAVEAREAAHRCQHAARRLGARGDAELVVQPFAPVDAEHEHELTHRVE